jgi:hypothetical protein
MKKYSVHMLGAALLLLLSVNTQAQTVKGTLQDNLSGDANQNGIANPGDTISYKATIKVTGATGTAIEYNNPTPANAALLSGTKTSALARNDTYSTPTNTLLNGVNVLSNDFGVPSPTVISFGPTATPAATAAGGTGTSNAGGTVTINASGALTYTPANGFTGTDQFAYIAGTGMLPNNAATVTITVAAAACAVADKYKEKCKVQNS